MNRSSFPMIGFPNGFCPSTAISCPSQTFLPDYHGSSSGSPSSSLSSPDMKVDNLGMDLTFCVPFHPNHNLLHSPSSSNGSPMFPPCGGGGPQTSPLPPVSHFSQQHNNNNNNQGMNQQQQQHTPTDQQSMLNGLFATHDTLSFFDDDRCSPSPPTSDRSSPMDNIPSIMMAAGSYEGPAFHASPLHNGVMMNGLSVAQQQLKSRSKMHEMAVKQRLITDQDPRSQGMVQLSAEERRTLIQEGFPVPTRLPLSKNEEEALKIVRRKIKNKLSAQESRRKRKEYMDTLEQRCQGYFSENTQLKGRVRQLEMSNKQLAAQLKKLQDMLGGGGAEH